MRVLFVLISLFLVGCNYAPQESTMESCIEQLEEYMGEEMRKDQIDSRGSTPEEADIYTKQVIVMRCAEYGEDEE